MTTKTLTPEDIFNLSDDEIANLDPAQLENVSIPSESEGNADDSTDDGANAAVAEAGSQSEGEEEAGEEGKDTASEGESDTESDSKNESEANGTKTTQEKTAEAKPGTEEKKPEATEPNYKAMYEELFEPFKANGKEIRVDSIADARALMQMGANYNKKMAGVKPHVKTLKLLENNDLLDEAKLNFLIDLDKKKPEAIKKLLKDSGIDPLDLDLKDVSDYKPTVRTVDEKQIALDEVLESIRDTPTFNRAISTVQGEWDDRSKQQLFNNPELLMMVNDHMANGIYDLISTQLEKDRMFGRLKGLSYLEAYKSVGDSIQAKGGFDHLAIKPKQESVPQAKNNTPAQNKVSEEARNEKRRAASPTAAAPKTVKDPQFNPLALSDEEFNKLTLKKFY